MTQQCYQHIFTPTNTTYIPHQNGRKTAFRKLIFHSSTFLPTTPTLKETNMCVSDEKTLSPILLSFIVTHTLTKTHLHLYHKRSTSSVLSSLGHQGGVVVKPYGAPLLEELSDLTRGWRNTHKCTQSHSFN